MAIDDKVAKELRQIRNVLILLALKSGATSDEVGAATGMGGGNVRALFSVKKKIAKAPSPSGNVAE